MGKSHDLATMASDGFAFPSAVTVTKPTNAELVTNGDFSNGTTGWTASGATLSVSSGQLTVADNGGYSKAYQGVTTVVNQTYTLSVTQVSVTGSNSVIGLSSAVPTGNTWGNMKTFSKASGDLPYTQTYIFKATGTTTYISVGSEGSHSAVFDNISLKEVGLPDSQILAAEDLTTEFTNLGMEVTASGIVTKPYNPHFWAKSANTQGDFSSGVICFASDNSLYSSGFQIGSSFNSANGRFTAPVDGVYHFSALVRIDGFSGNYSFLTLYDVNDSGTEYFSRDLTSQGGTYNTQTVAASRYLSAGDYVYAKFQTTGDTNTTISSDSFFSGHFVG